MAIPCCPKCSGTTFHRSQNTTVRVWMIYCARCGSVIGTLPLGFKSKKTGKTSGDSWLGAGSTTASKGSPSAGTTPDDWETIV